MSLPDNSYFTRLDGRRSAVVDGSGESLPRSPRTVRRTPGFTCAFLCLLLYVLWAPAAFAGGGDVCMVDRYNTVQGTSSDSLNCTANDVVLAVYELAAGQSSCVAGETIQVQLKGEFLSTATTRWDVGVLIAEGNNDPNTTGGACYTDFLNPVSANNTDLDLVGGAGPYYNGELLDDPTDFCGDIQSGARVSFITGLISLVCQDSDGDNVATSTPVQYGPTPKLDGTVNKPSCQDECGCHRRNNRQVHLFFGKHRRS